MIKNKSIFLLSLFIAFFFTNKFAVYSQSKFLLSAGTSFKWSYSDSTFNVVGTDDVVSEGNIGYFASIGICWFDNPDFTMVSRITYEKYRSQLQNWERTQIGSLNANIFRIDPLIFHGRIKKSKFLYNFNLIGINIYTAKGESLPNSFCYDNGNWYLIYQIHINNSLGWSFLGGGIEYEFTPFIQAGVETVFIEEEKINVTFLTDYGEVNSKVSSVNSLFPVKLKVVIKI
ncbi:MAG: hypothetical protein ACOYOV_15905 [Bacteroidales bacterium]